MASGTSITVVNLDNLPQGMSVNISGGSRSGNSVSCNNQRFTMTIEFQDDDARFPAGSIVQMAFTNSVWSKNYLRVYWRGKEVGHYGTAGGNAVWSVVSGPGMSTQDGESPIGRDATTWVRTNKSGEVILQMTFTKECWGFDLHFGSVLWSDWSGAAGTGSFDFQYLTTQFESPDPNEQGGISETGGGTGTFDTASDSLDFNSPPALTAVDAGFISLFNPTLAELKSLANYMWANLVSWETIRKLFADPMDAILGLNIVPVAVPDGTRREIKVGGIGTGITMTLAASQYVVVDCGSLTIPEYWGSALDYSPYTKIQCYLPYIGFVPLDTDDVMGRTITIQYKVDILTGACIAQIKSVGGTHSTLNAVIYTFAGHCAQNIPVTGVNYSQLISAVIGVATTAISAGAGIAGAAAGASAASSALGVAEASARETLSVGPPTPMDAANIKAETDKASSAVKKAEAAKVQNIFNGINNTVGQVMGVKPSVGHSGSISAVSGMLGIQKPYLIIERPRQSLAKNYKHYVGYPANITFEFSELTGFTSFEQIILDNIPATDPEIAELYELLKGGVYF